MERQAWSAGHTVSADGVTVQQYYASETFDLPSVVFDVATERAESVEVRFVVTDIEARRVGFHPRFRSDAWTISDGRLVFEATVGPDETVTTLYALDTDDEAVFERAMERLRIERVTASDRDAPSLDLEFGDTAVAEQREAATAPAADPTPVEEPTTDGSTGGERAETTAGDGGELLQPRGSERDDAGATGERARSTDAGVTGAEGAGGELSGRAEPVSSGSGGSAVDDTDTGEGEFTEQSADALVEELLGRLDRDELPPAARERLAERVTGEQSGANEARLASLQTRVSDLEAFGHPMEQLLDEHGNPAAVLDAFDERLTALEGLDERVSELETHVETVEEHESRIERLGEQVTALGDELDTTTAQFETDVAEVETQLESLRTELERVEDSAEAARERASDVGVHTGELDERLAELAEQFDGLERRLDSVTGDWESVEADIAALQEWRSNLASTFGTVGE